VTGGPGAGDSLHEKYSYYLGFCRAFDGFDDRFFSRSVTAPRGSALCTIRIVVEAHFYPSQHVRTSRREFTYAMKDTLDVNDEALRSCIAKYRSMIAKN
ncbi:MAG TPA: hypothetical protein VGC95_11410, partial [Chitinophagaceae bacterium]